MIKGRGPVWNARHVAPVAPFTLGECGARTPGRGLPSPLPRVRGASPRCRGTRPLETEGEGAGEGVARAEARALALLLCLSLPCVWELQRDRSRHPLMILPQVHLRKPCYDFYFL